jgi:hypothetical protein
MRRKDNPAVLDQVSFPVNGGFDVTVAPASAFLLTLNK